MRSASGCGWVDHLRFDADAPRLRQLALAAVFHRHGEERQRLVKASHFDMHLLIGQQAAADT